MLILSIAAILIVTLVCPLIFQAWAIWTERKKATTNHTSFSQRTIQGVPKRSVTIPKRLAKNVSAIGTPTVPPSAKAL
jgi:hypothetical protein